jgi:hypothetical protein
VRLEIACERHGIDLRRLVRECVHDTTVRSLRASNSTNSCKDLHVPGGIPW